MWVGSARQAPGHGVRQRRHFPSRPPVGPRRDSLPIPTGESSSPAGLAPLCRVAGAADPSGTLSSAVASHLDTGTPRVGFSKQQKDPACRPRCAHCQTSGGLPASLLGAHLAGQAGVGDPEGKGSAPASSSCRLPRRHDVSLSLFPHLQNGGDTPAHRALLQEQEQSASCLKNGMLPRKPWFEPRQS